jgi:large subunit ribosomal protein L29
MKTEELRELDAEELGGRLKGARRELYELRFKLAVGQLDNHREIRKARKEIAQILTVVHQRRLGAEGEPLVSHGDADQQRQAVTEERPDDLAEGEGDARPSAAAEVEAGEAETAASAGSAEGQEGVAADAVDQGDVEAGRAKRRRSRKADNEDEG